MYATMPGRTMTPSGSRPAALVRALMSAWKAVARSYVVWAVKIASAWRAAKSLPSSEDPAWTSSG